MKTRTVLDFKRKAPNLPQQVYEIKRIRDIYKAIEDQEIRGYQEGICVTFHKDCNVNYTQITEDYGFQIEFSSGNRLNENEEYTHVINYFGYPVWVYYNDKDEPVHFDFRGARNSNNPPHLSDSRSDWFKRGKYKRYEKIYLI